MNTMKKLILFAFLLSAFLCNSQTKLPSFFSDNMVLQQNENVSVWGTDNEGVKITVTASWGEQATTITGKDQRWKVKIKTPSAGGPYSLTINGSEKVILDNVLIGEVWLCSGQSNMQMSVKQADYLHSTCSNEVLLESRKTNIRLFKVPRVPSLTPQDDVESKWSLANPSTVGNFTAVGYFFGKKLYDVLNVPIGLIEADWGGSSVETWMDKETMSEFKKINELKEIPQKSPQKCPSLLFNGMINPMLGYTMKGVIWYQGESNRHNPKEYKHLFPAMIKSWRNQWEQGDFPFYFVQIAPFNYNKGNVAFVREAQLQTFQTVKKTGMVVTLDVGECEDIHPREKGVVGHRLAYWALANDYNITGIDYCGPIYKEIIQNKDGKITVSFDYVENSLSSMCKELQGFEIASKDKVFHPAKASFDWKKGTVTVWAEAVKNPVAVRYAFRNCVKGNLYSKSGIPASPFRTDDWDK